MLKLSITSDFMHNLKQQLQINLTLSAAQAPRNLPKWSRFENSLTQGCEGECDNDIIDNRCISTGAQVPSEASWGVKERVRWRGNAEGGGGAGLGGVWKSLANRLGSGGVRRGPEAGRKGSGGGRRAHKGGERLGSATRRSPTPSSSTQPTSRSFGDVA